MFTESPLNAAIISSILFGLAHYPISLGATAAFETVLGK
jgi:membrane protease YdiL (CAAX protease family)